MVTVRRLVIRPPGPDQQAIPAQEIEQGITPYAQPFGHQRRANQVVQLARAQAGLAQALLLHQAHNPFVLGFVARPTALPLVVRLPADAHVAASPRHVQPFDGLLREDLPTGFFTTCTP